MNVIGLIHCFDRAISFLLRMLDEKILFPVRFRMLTEKLSPYLQDCKKILDVGSSDGRLAKYLQDVVGGEFLGVDILVPPVTAISVEKYDGKKLPFKDKSFDCVMMIDMLHHTSNWEEVLQEAKRVSSKYILIKDHYWNTRLDFFILKVADFIGNKPYNIDLPYKYLRFIDWKIVFSRNGLDLIAEKTFRFTAMDPTKQVIFKMKV